MESPHRRRTGSVAVLLSLVFGLLAFGPGTAVATTDRAAAKANSAWLARQIGADGTLQNPNGGALPDHGLMIDVLYAMYASGDGDLAEPIVSFLDDQRHASDYFTWDGLVPDMGYEDIITGGAAAKTLVAAEIAGRDPRSFGGWDLVAETLGAIPRSGPDKGRISDYSKNPDFADYVSNNANMFGQALAVIGLAGVGENDQLAIDRLLTQQCSEGFFRIFFGFIATDETGDHVDASGRKLSSCDEGKPFDISPPDRDATGFALSALLAAREAGATGLDPAITKAVAWLRSEQKPHGGWGGGVGTEAPNTNSTGLVVQALADAGGSDTAVANGTAYLRSAQATAAADSANMLAEHLGGIAYTPESYVAARTGGIIGYDTWIRAGAQASLGVSKVGFHDLTRGTIPPDGEDPVDPPPPPAPTTNPPAPPPVSEKAGHRGPPAGSKGKVVTPPVARTEPGSATPAGRLGNYLAAQLVDGDHVEVTVDGATFVDYDATANLVLALRTLGEQPVAVTRASRFLLNADSVAAYAHGVPYETTDSAYAEPLAKLRIVAQFWLAGDPPDAPADLPVIADRLRTDLVALRSDDGEFVDTGEFADEGTSLRRHAFAVLATASRVPTDEAEAAIGLLLGSRCADGTFPATLSTKDCANGDLAATAAAIEALNGRPRPVTSEVDGIRKAAAGSTAWPADRTDALADAALALNDQVNDDGVVLGESGDVDLALSAAAASGRQAAGLDAGDTAAALGELVLADGGLAPPSRDTSDFTTSLTAAPGVAGRSWTSAPDSPVTAAVRLPIAQQADPDPTAAAQTAPDGVPTWLFAVGLFLAAGLGYVLRLFPTRKPQTPKVAIP